MIYDPDNQGDQGHKERAELNKSWPCYHANHPLSVCKGGKEVFHPQKGGAAYRGTDSTMDSITQNDIKCKKNRSMDR